MMQVQIQDTTKWVQRSRAR